ncbi:hypothetical protein ANCCEY_02591 [Ancylostoma ceylanicum]|uniref:Uncharacterized protein n=1 Tax=Ancylostoma ceylanicum TaxID=53326 RepID=A0A0D6M2F7_9BILA|nr:hypothetical protein ANCCEY_02591 [Ancylostoma ceylanicum]
MALISTDQARDHNGSHRGSNQQLHSMKQAARPDASTRGQIGRSCEKHFPSLQMLITHHSVMPEKLPVALVFVQWNSSDWQEVSELPPPVAAVDEYRHSYIAPHTKYTETDENRNSK